MRIFLGDLAINKFKAFKVVEERILKSLDKWEASEEEKESIKALIDKIDHMINHIGCPESVLPMLESIANRKLKHWQDYQGITVDKKRVPHNGSCLKFNEWYGKGKQLKNKDQINRVKSDKYDENRNFGKIISGHFRWNERGYILTYNMTKFIELLIRTEF